MARDTAARAALSRFEAARVGLGDVRGTGAPIRSVAFLSTICWRDVSLVAGCGRDDAAAALAMRFLMGMGWADVGRALGVTAPGAQSLVAEGIRTLAEVGR